MSNPRFRISRLFFLSSFLVLLGAFIWVGCQDAPDAILGPVTQTTEGGSLSKAQMAEIDNVMRIQNQHTDELMAKRGVVGTATGLTPDGRVGVIVLTRGDENIGDFPLRIQGTPLILEEVGDIVALQQDQGNGGNATGKPGGGGSVDPTSRFPRPVPIGVSTGHPAITAGTIGCRVTDGANVYALSNNHVYANQNQASLGDAVIQPGTYDGGSSPADNIGNLSAFEPIKFDGSDNTIDAAIASTTTSLVGNSTPSDGYGTPKRETLAAAINMKLMKYGRTTGLTTGRVYAVNATVNVGYGDNIVARFVNQIVITPGSFSAGGDSGSLIVNNDRGDNKGKPVGLLFAGSPSVTIANPIGAVLNRFGVSVDGQ